MKFSVEHILHINRDIAVLNLPHVLIWLMIGLIQFGVAFSGSLLIAVVAKKLLTKLGIKHTRYFIGA